MALPNGRQDIVGCKVVNADLALTVTATANVATQTSATITNPTPRTQVVLFSMTSGTSIQVQMDTAAAGATPTFASGALVSYTISAANGQGYLLINTTSATPNWGVKLTATGGPLVPTFCVLSLDQLQLGQDWVNVSSASNAVASLLNGNGTGGGVFAVTPA